MKLFVLIVHDTDWVWNGEDSVLVETESCGGVFSTKELAEEAGKKYSKHDIIETELDKHFNSRF